MTINELVAEMKGNQTYGKLFESDQQFGGPGMKPGQQKRVPAKASDMTSVQKIAAGLGKGQHQRR
jgi:hypothetical protein